MKNISSVDYVSLPIMTANFYDGGVFFYFAHIRDELICTPLGGEQCGGEVIFNINPFRVFAVHSVLDDR